MKPSMVVFPALRRMRQDYCCEFEDNLGNGEFKAILHYKDRLCFKKNEEETNEN